MTKPVIGFIGLANRLAKVHYLSLYHGLGTSFFKNPKFPGQHFSQKATFSRTAREIIFIRVFRSFKEFFGIFILS